MDVYLNEIDKPSKYVAALVHYSPIDSLPTNLAVFQIRLCYGYIFIMLYASNEAC